MDLIDKVISVLLRHYPFRKWWENLSDDKKRVIKEEIATIICNHFEM